MISPLNPIDPGIDPQIRPGARIGDYAVADFLASGGFGSVYRLDNTALGRPAALKVLHPELRLGDAMARFAREAEVLRMLDHPNVLAIYESGALPDGRAYLVTELLSGIDLEEHLERSGPMSLDDTLSILEPTCGALAAAHARGVIHRDVKASNIFLDHSAGVRRVVLLDFGLAKLLEGDPGLTSSRMALGTPASMSPEQIRGGRVDARTDVYGLGALVYHMLTGRLPFDGASRSTITYMHLHGKRPRASRGGRVPAAVDDVIDRAMAVDPCARHDSVSELLDALREASRPVLARGSRAVKTIDPRRAIAIHVEARVLADADDDAVLDAVEGVLARARHDLEPLGFTPVFETACSTALAKLLDGDDAAVRRAAAEAALALHRSAVELAGGRAEIAIVLHVDDATCGANRIWGGALLQLERWLPLRSIPGVAATPSAMSGLDLPTTNVPETSLCLLVPASATGATHPAISWEQLAHTEVLAQLGRSTAGILHDARSPLTTILCNLQSLVDQGGLSADQLDAVTDTITAAQQLEVMVRGLVRSTRSTDDDAPHGLVSVSEIVEAAVNLTRVQVGRRIEIVVRRYTDAFLFGHRDQLIRVLVNLIGNAVDAIDRRGSITVSFGETPAGRVEIAVRDTGAGMRPEIQARAFDPFFTTKDHGTGIGLALVRDTVSKHGGRIKLDSTLGVGTCVTMSFPTIADRPS